MSAVAMGWGVFVVSIGACVSITGVIVSVEVLVFAPIRVGVGVKVGVGWVGVIVRVSVAETTGAGGAACVWVAVTRKLEIGTDGIAHDARIKLPIRKIPIFFISNPFDETRMSATQTP
jgi:hypothetical protein